MLQRPMKILAAALLLIMVAMDGFALEVPYLYNESRVEVAFLYNLTKFVTWPERSFDDSLSPLVFAVFDSARYEAAREALAGRKVGGRVVTIRKIFDIDDVRHAHLLFIDAAEAHRLDQLLDAVAGQPVLTVSDIEGFAGRGGMVELFKSERKIRFGIQLAVVLKSGLSMSSEVLRLASFVQGSNEGKKQ